MEIYDYRQVMLCWKEETKEIKVIRHPDFNHESRGWSAIWTSGDGKFNKNQARILFMSEAFDILRKGFAVDDVISALMQIDAVRDALTTDVWSTRISGGNFT